MHSTINRLMKTMGYLWNSAQWHHLITGIGLSASKITVSAGHLMPMPYKRCSMRQRREKPAQNRHWNQNATAHLNTDNTDNTDNEIRTQRMTEIIQPATKLGHPKTEIDLIIYSDHTMFAYKDHTCLSEGKSLLNPPPFIHGLLHPQLWNRLFYHLNFPKPSILPHGWFFDSGFTTVTTGLL